MLPRRHGGIERTTVEELGWGKVRAGGSILFLARRGCWRCELAGNRDRRTGAVAAVRQAGPAVARLPQGMTV